MTAPPPPADPPPTRGTTAALAVAGAVLLGLLALRGYGHHWGARPTEAGIAAGIDLNRADAVDLEQVPGLGPKRAAAIVTHRAAHGPFADADELTRVPGVGPHTAEKAGAYLTIPPTAVPLPDTLERKDVGTRTVTRPAPGPGGKLAPGDKLDVNAATEAELQRLPGIGPTLARRIVEVRGGGRFSSADDLRRVRGIGAKTLENLRPYVVVGK